MSVSVLQFQRDGNRLMATYLRGAERLAGRPFEDSRLLEQWSSQYIELMERALALPLTDHRGTLAEFGRCLFDNLLTGELGEALRRAEPQTLVVDLPESMLWLPVEILHDGTDFMGIRHALGRRITVWEGPPPARSSPRRDGRVRPSFLFVAGHAEDDAFFEVTRREIYELCDQVTASDRFEVQELKVDNSISRSELLRALSSSDFLHFSGHSDSAAGGQAGWVFEDFRFSPADVQALGGCDPFFVFSNSCRSTAVSQWSEVRDLVRAFYERGTQHFIGASTRIHYKRAAEFADAFYQSFLTGETIGESVRRAREAVLRNPTHHDPCWLSYVLYGDPSFRISDLKRMPAQGEARVIAVASPAQPALRPGHVLCAWSGRETPSSSAVRCASSGCAALIGLDAQLQQRRGWLDLAIHGDPSSAAEAATRRVYCPEHVPPSLRGILQRAATANALVQAGRGICAWTGREATRAELLQDVFTQTPYGLMSPEARTKYTCAATGAIITPEQARENRGFITHMGKTLTEAPYWLGLNVGQNPTVSNEQALQAETMARAATWQRLNALESLETSEANYTALRLKGVEYRGDENAAALLQGSGRLLRSGLSVGIVHWPVRHNEHYARFGHDRQPATLADMERAGRELEQVSGAKVTLALLASPTGWSDEARQQARALEPGSVVVILKNTGPRQEPLAFNKGAALAEALKVELAGGLLLGA